MQSVKHILHIFVPANMKDLNYFKKQLVRVEYHIHIINILLTRAI